MIFVYLSVYEFSWNAMMVVQFWHIYIFILWKLKSWLSSHDHRLIHCAMQIQSKVRFWDFFLLEMKQKILSLYTELWQLRQVAFISALKNFPVTASIVLFLYFKDRVPFISLYFKNRVSFMSLYFKSQSIIYFIIF